MSTLNGQRGEKIASALSKYYHNRDAYIDHLVDETFSPEVLADFKEVLKGIKKFALGSLTPAAACKLLLTAYLFKDYPSLEQLLSKADLRGIHTRDGSGVKAVGDRSVQLREGKQYARNDEQYSRTLSMLEKYLVPIVSLDKSEHTLIGDLNKEFQKFTHNQKFNAVLTPEFIVEKYLDNYQEDKPCLVDITLLLSKYLSTLDFEQTKKNVYTAGAAVKANLELNGFGEKFTEEILPVGESFRQTYLAEEAHNISEFYWKRRHMYVWYNLLSCYGISLVNKHPSVEYITKQLLEPVSGSMFTSVEPDCSFVCYTRGNTSSIFHTRIFGVYKIGEYKKMLKATFEYYRQHPQSFKNYAARFDDITKSMFMPCITVQAPYDEADDLLKYGVLFSKLRIW